MSKRKNRKKYPVYHPFYWPIWCLYPLLRALAFLPPRCLMPLGDIVGRMIPKFSKRLAHITEVNLRMCFPELSRKERDNLQERHFKAMGRSLFETLLAWWAPQKTIDDLVDIQTLDHIKAGLAKGKGVIAVAAHFTSTELVGRGYCHVQPFSAVYQPVKNPVLDRIVYKGRKRFIDELIPSHDIRRILQALANNQVIWFAPDQNTQRKRRVFAPFFGHLATTSTMLSRLHELSGATIVLSSYDRHEDGSYVCHADPVTDNFPSGNAVEDAAYYNEYLERSIRANPEQYLWGYKFFSHRPEGEAKVYKSNKEL